MTDDLSGRVAELEATVEALQARVSELESDAETTQTTGDRRDAAVIDVLEAGATYTLAQLKSIYRAETDIRNNRTLKRRVRDLVTSDGFEAVKHGTWRFTGGGDV